VCGGDRDNKGEGSHLTQLPTPHPPPPATCASVELSRDSETVNTNLLAEFSQRNAVWVSAWAYVSILPLCRVGKGQEKGTFDGAFS
jgi:hypothetical protein